MEINRPKIPHQEIVKVTVRQTKYADMLGVIICPSMNITLEKFAMLQREGENSREHGQFQQLKLWASI